MNVQQFANHFVVYRGRGDRMAYFSFFVDAHKTSWSKRIQQAQMYATVEDAQKTIKRIRERAKSR